MRRHELDRSRHRGGTQPQARGASATVAAASVPQRARDGAAKARPSGGQTQISAAVVQADARPRGRSRCPTACGCVPPRWPSDLGRGGRDEAGFDVQVDGDRIGILCPGRARVAGVKARAVAAVAAVASRVASPHDSRRAASVTDPDASTVSRNRAGVRAASRRRGSGPGSPAGAAEPLAPAAPGRRRIDRRPPPPRRPGCRRRRDPPARLLRPAVVESRAECPGRGDRQQHVGARRLGTHEAHVDHLAVRRDRDLESRVTLTRAGLQRRFRSTGAVQRRLPDRTARLVGAGEDPSPEPPGPGSSEAIRSGTARSPDARGR